LEALGAREKSVTTHFTTIQIRGKGRGKLLGYPTINMKIPVDFDLPDGIYAAWVTIGTTRYGGALHWGPIPTFKEEMKSLEVFVVDRILTR
jgi:riboflavin kinase/FMN adenylyltransferase